ASPKLLYFNCCTLLYSGDTGCFRRWLMTTQALIISGGRAKRHSKPSQVANPHKHSEYRIFLTT
ncbi:MAG: hypothetical protein AAFN68_13760, partial [Pseudomonadota bacterium]